MVNGETFSFVFISVFVDLRRNRAMLAGRRRLTFHLRY